jgi:hypothetical protein
LVADLIELTERYCVVLQTLAGAPVLTVELDRRPDFKRQRAT